VCVGVSVSGFVYASLSVCVYLSQYMCVCQCVWLCLSVCVTHSVCVFLCVFIFVYMCVCLLRLSSMEQIGQDSLWKYHQEFSLTSSLSCHRLLMLQANETLGTEVESQDQMGVKRVRNWREYHRAMTSSRNVSHIGIFCLYISATLKNALESYGCFPW